MACMLQPMVLDKAWRSYQERQPKATDRLGLAVHRFVMPILRPRFDTSTSEDLAQETVLVVFSEIDAFEYRDARSFEAWIRRITVNRVLHHLRGERRRARIAAQCAHEAARVESGPHEQTHWRERLELVAAALSQVEPSFVSALLHLASGRDPAELADAEGVAKMTVYTRAHRGLVRLRSALEARRTSTGRFLATPRC